jgi:Skp family chaperone for outer membrane proteins
MAENKEKQAEELEALQAEIKELQEQNAQQAEIIQQQAEALAQKDEEVKASGRYPVLELGKKQYELIVAKSKARYNGKQVDITEKSLREDKKLLEHCVKSGFGILREKGAEA